MPTHSERAQETIDSIVTVTAFRLQSMAANIERLNAAGASATAAEVAEEARRYAVHRRRDYMVAVNDLFDAEMLDAGIPMDLIVKSPIVWESNGG